MTVMHALEQGACMDGMAEWWLVRGRREFEQKREREARLLLTAATMRFRANDL